MIGWYILQIQGDVEPFLYGPFASHKEMFSKARQLRKEDSGLRHGLFKVNLAQSLEIFSFSGKELS